MQSALPINLYFHSYILSHFFFTEIILYQTGPYVFLFFACVGFLPVRSDVVQMIERLDEAAIRFFALL